MGLLDQAIREHLELKRQHGADPGEVARLEREALGPPVREQYREPVGPADERPVRAGVANALGEAVPHRDVRPDH